MDRNVLHRFFAGTASFEEEEAVCDWVDASDKNREELIRERKYFDVLLLHKTKNSSMVQSGHRFSLPFVIRESLKIAAAISVLLVSALYISNNVGKSAPVLEMNNIVLSDRTKVHLNAESQLTYPICFSDKERIVQVEGEAYFDVSKDVEHPFVVQTKKCDIKVLGTEFNVRVNEAESDCEFSAALLEGSIELTNKMEPGPSIRLAPMQKEGLICFEDIRFADLMKRFEKTYDIRIVIQNKSLHDYKCSGKCRVSDGVDFILQVLQRSTRFTFSRSDDNTIIYIK